MEHADKLVERIIFLDGFPNMQVLDPLHIGQNVKEVLDCDLAPEMSARALYEEAATHCHAVKDYVSRDLFEKLMKRRGSTTSTSSKRSSISSPSSASSSTPSITSASSTRTITTERELRPRPMPASSGVSALNDKPNATRARRSFGSHHWRTNRYLLAHALV